MLSVRVCGQYVLNIGGWFRVQYHHHVAGGSTSKDCAHVKKRIPGPGPFSPERHQQWSPLFLRRAVVGSSFISWGENAWARVGGPPKQAGNVQKGPTEVHEYVLKAFAGCTCWCTVRRYLRTVGMHGAQSASVEGQTKLCYNGHRAAMWRAWPAGFWGAALVRSYGITIMREDHPKIARRL